VRQRGRAGDETLELFAYVEREGHFVISATSL
jgi:hypothetical protein